MKEEGAAPPPLGVAGKLDATEGQVGVSLRLDLLAKRPAECLTVGSHDEAVRVADGARGIAGVDAHHQRVIQASGPLQDGASPADSPQERDAQPFAGFGFQAQRGGDWIRTIGKRRAEFNIGLGNMVYNLFRYMQLGKSMT